MENFLHTPVTFKGITTGCSINDLVSKMGKTAFQGRNVAKAREIWINMLEDSATIMMGLAGAMIPAGMREIIVYLIENRLIDCLISTGANLFHDCHEILGRSHFQGRADVDDDDLFSHGIDRIYDVFASENEFRDTDDFVTDWAKTLDYTQPITTREFFYRLGEYLAKRSKREGILTAAYKAKVPIYCPALGDSSIGIAIATGRRNGTNSINFDIIQDVLETADITWESKSTGVIYIGGGTPKNFLQQTEVTASFFHNVESRGHNYAIQIIVDPPHWGGLSGCTFKEAKSWGKISKNSKNVTVYSDATITLPLIVTSVAEKAKDIIIKRKKPVFEFEKKFKIIIEG